jgi:multiple sugar transport system permease protein
MAQQQAAAPPIARTKPGGQTRTRTVVRTISFVVLVAFVVVWLVPFAWAIDTALKPEGETTIVPITWWSSHFNFDAFGKILSAGNLARWYLNSVINSVVITISVVVLASLAAYAFSQIRFRGRWFLFWLVMAGLMVPGQLLIVPLFTMMNDLNFVDTYWGVILPQLASPIAVFVFKQFFDGIPHEFGEAAVLDGATKFRIYVQVWMPLSRSAIAAVSIFTFVWSWNNFLWPLIVLQSTEMMPLTVGLSTVISSYGLQYAQIMASAVLATIPILLVFAIFQRQIVEGIASSGVKG